MRVKIPEAVAVAAGVAVFAGVALLATTRLWVADADEVDPKRWAELFPLHHEATLKTRLTEERYDRLEANPFRRRAFAGHPFALDYQSARGHFYAQIDQRESGRTKEYDQPAACVHCHAAEAPGLVAEHGWEGFHKLKYNDLKDGLHHGSSCSDCHSPKTMQLRVSRVAFIKGMEQRGVDVTRADRQALRTFVCAQCHVEYYFRGKDRELAFPWRHGHRLEQIEEHYDDDGFHDWVHADTGAPMIKVQHPEFELFSTGTHAKLGVSCVDCHMPETREDGVRLSDHRIRGSMAGMKDACLKCHQGTEESLVRRTDEIRERTLEQLKITEGAIDDLMKAIVSARDKGADDAALEEARRYHRRAQLRWDFIDAENSTGFHSPHETARILIHAVDMARRGERSAIEAASKSGK